MQIATNVQRSSEAQLVWAFMAKLVVITKLLPGRARWRQPRVWLNPLALECAACLCLAERCTLSSAPRQELPSSLSTSDNWLSSRPASAWPRHEKILLKAPRTHINIACHRMPGKMGVQGPKGHKPIWTKSGQDRTWLHRDCFAKRTVKGPCW